MQYERKKCEVLTIGQLIEILKQYPMDSNAELTMWYSCEDSHGVYSNSINSCVDGVWINGNTVYIEGYKDKDYLYNE